MGGAGFEPAKAEPTDLQSVPFDRFGNPPSGLFTLKISGEPIQDSTKTFKTKDLGSKKP